MGVLSKQARYQTDLGTNKLTYTQREQPGDQDQGPRLVFSVESSRMCSASDPPKHSFINQPAKHCCWKMLSMADIYTSVILSRQNRQLNLQTQTLYCELSDELWFFCKCVHEFPKDLKFVCSQNHPLGFLVGIILNPPSACFLTPCGILFLRINYCHLTLFLTHYFQMVLLLFFAQLHTKMLWPSLNWSQQQQGKQSPIYAIKDFKDRKVFPFFIQFLISSPETMYHFSAHHLFHHFPVFLWLTLYTPNI